MSFYNYILKYIIFGFADKLMKTDIIGFYKQISKMYTWSSQNIEEWQNTRLKSLITHAYNTTPYYKEVFDSINLKPSDINTIKDLSKIPVLTRQEAIKNYDKLISTVVKKDSYKISKTGGTTGMPLKYLLDKKSWSFSNANNIFNWERTSYNFGDRHIALGSTSLYIGKKKSLKHEIFYRLKRRKGLSGINMSDKVCKEYISIIKKEKIKFIYGYTSAIYLLANYCLKNNITVNIDVCFPTSEMLLDLYRETIIKAFNCKIVNCYGAHDGGISAHEHKKGVFEVGYGSLVTIKDGSNEGSALLTDLYNFAMPFINYEIGDFVQLNKECNSYNGQVIEDIKGRTFDIIELDNGRKLTLQGFIVLFRNLPVYAFNVSKEGDNNILCKVKIKENFTKKDEQLVLSTIKKHIGTKANVSIEYLDKFELSNSGKRNHYLLDKK